MGTTRIGFIGTGGIARRHAKRLLADGNVEIVAAVEPSEEAFQRWVADGLDGDTAPPLYDSLPGMLDAHELDAAVICSPHTVHHEQLMTCLDAGLHVLCEKPMVCSTDHAREVIDACRRTGRHVVVSYQRRFQAQFRYMKEFIRSPEFGKVLMVSVFQSQNWLNGQTGKWRQQLALSGGGQLNDSGSHVIDVITWMLPEKIREVSAMISNRGREVDIDSVVSFRTAGETLGSLTILGSAPHKGMCEDITISGENGRAIFARRGTGEEVLKTTGRFGDPLADASGLDRVQSSDPDTHFLAVIRGEAENASSPESFLNVIAFTEACWRSAENGGAPQQLA